MALTRDSRLWFNMAGAVACYQPVGAPGSLLARYNMAHGGSNSHKAADGTAPPWASKTGWAFDGTTSSRYLTTGIVIGGVNWSALVRFSNVVEGAALLFGSYDGVGTDKRFGILPSLGGAIYYEYGIATTGWLSITATVTQGVLGMAGNLAYRNGVQEAGSISAVSAATRPIYIGAWNIDPLSGFVNAKIQALAIYSRTLTPAEIRLATLQMQYCEVNLDWDAWSARRKYYFVSLAPTLSVEQVGAAIRLTWS